MITFLDLAIGLARSWTSCYTLGLDPDTKAGRRAEIESDLWDQKRLASLQRDSLFTTAIQVLMRALLGVHADIAWRAEAAFDARERRKGQMNETWKSRLGLLVGIAFALLPVAFGAAIIAGNGDWDSTGQRMLWGGIWIFAGSMIVTGLVLSRSTYGGGMALVALGVVVFCVSTFWMALVSVPVGIVLLALAHLRGRSSPVLQNPGTP